MPSSTAIRSLPSTCRQCRPPARPFCASVCGAGLRRARHRDRPAVVDHAQHQRRGVGAGGIERGVEVGLRRTAVAAAGHRDAVLLAQLERQRGAGGHQALRGDRHAPRVVVLRAGEIVAALVAAPVQQHFARLHAAHELRAVLAVAGREHVFRPHRGADADVGGLVAQAAGIGAELAGALQRDRLGVEHAHEQHLLEQRQQRLGVAEGGRQFGDQLAVRAEVLQVFDLECRGDGHCVTSVSVSRSMIPGPRKRGVARCGKTGAHADPMRYPFCVSPGHDNDCRQDNQRQLETGIHTDLPAG